MQRTMFKILDLARFNLRKSHWQQRKTAYSCCAESVPPFQYGRDTLCHQVGNGQESNGEQGAVAAE